MLIVALVGKSDTGKTTTIIHLIEELSDRGYKVGCIKHCPRGFDMDHKGKDSYRFYKAGAKGVLVSSSERKGLIKKICEDSTLKEVSIEHFLGMDFVLVEGFKEGEGVVKLELLRKGVNEEPVVEDAAAILSDFCADIDKKCIDLNNAKEIVDFLEELKKSEEKLMNVKVNQEHISLNPFVQSIFREVITGLIRPLKRKDKNIKKIEIKFEV